MEYAIGLVILIVGCAFYAIKKTVKREKEEAARIDKLFSPIEKKESTHNERRVSVSKHSSFGGGIGQFGSGRNTVGLVSPNFGRRAKTRLPIPSGYLPSKREEKRTEQAGLTDVLLAGAAGYMVGTSLSSSSRNSDNSTTAFTGGGGSFDGGGATASWGNGSDSDNSSSSSSSSDSSSSSSSSSSDSGGGSDSSGGSSE